MRVSSTGLLSVASIRWQPAPGSFVLTVVAKAMFRLRPGLSPLIVAVEPPALVDLAPIKPRADVVVIGHAHAPPGEAVGRLRVRVAVGDVHKAIDVHGDRRWSADGRLSAPEPFTSMPLGWERAAGGPGRWNPVGVPPGAELAPNLLPVGFEPRSRAQEIPPVGLGPIAPDWPARAEKLGAHAEGWSHERWAEQPLPGDLDAAYFNLAPPDQQRDALQHGEELLLEHLHPEHPRLVTALQKLRLWAELSRSGARTKELALRGDTLWIDAARGIAWLIFRGTVRLRSPDEDGEVRVGAEQDAGDEVEQGAFAKPAQHIEAEPAQHIDDEPAQHIDDEVTLVGAPVLLDAQRAEEDEERTLVRGMPSPVRPQLGRLQLGTLQLTRAAEQGPALPFQPAPAGAPANAEAADAEADTAELPAMTPELAARIAAPPADAKTSIPWLQRARSTLPFVRAAATPPAAVTPPDTIEDTVALHDEETFVPELVPPSRPALPFQPAPPVIEEPEEQTFVPELAPVPAPRSRPTLPFLRTAAVAPPPSSAPWPAGSDVSTSARALDQLPAVAAKQQPEPSEPEAIAVPRYARIQAELWQRRGALDEVLERHGLDEITWRANERRYAELIAREASEGRCDTAAALAGAIQEAQRAQAP